MAWTNALKTLMTDIDFIGLKLIISRPKIPRAGSWSDWSPWRLCGRGEGCVYTRNSVIIYFYSLFYINQDPRLWQPCPLLRGRRVRGRGAIQRWEKTALVSNSSVSELYFELWLGDTFTLVIKGYFGLIENCEWVISKSQLYIEKKSIKIC